MVGWEEGEAEGAWEGVTVDFVGRSVGCREGDDIGLWEGNGEGRSVGEKEGELRGVSLGI